MIIMLVEKTNIKTYIPQREPFVMIDSLIEANEIGFSSSFFIDNDHIFIENNILSEAAIIENIEQTCAAGFGYLSSLEVESEPRLGFIGAITKLEVFNEIKTNVMIETHVSIINTFENIHLIEGIARSSNIDILKCQMKIVLS